MAYQYELTDNAQKLYDEELKSRVTKHQVWQFAMQRGMLTDTGKISFPAVAAFITQSEKPGLEPEQTPLPKNVRIVSFAESIPARQNEVGFARQDAESKAESGAYKALKKVLRKQESMVIRENQLHAERSISVQYATRNNTRVLSWYADTPRFRPIQDVELYGNEAPMLLFKVVFTYYTCLPQYLAESTVFSQTGLGAKHNRTGLETVNKSTRVFYCDASGNLYNVKRDNTSLHGFAGSRTTANAENIPVDNAKFADMVSDWINEFLTNAENGEQHKVGFTAYLTEDLTLSAKGRYLLNGFSEKPYKIDTDKDGTEYLKDRNAVIVCNLYRAIARNMESGNVADLKAVHGLVQDLLLKFQPEFEKDNPYKVKRLVADTSAKVSPFDLLANLPEPLLTAVTNTLK